MIEVEDLTKRFGSILAVDRIGFTVGRGEIVGLLGPNGAGKSTTMRMLTTYLAATSGRAAIAGSDVSLQPLEVRRKVGYLPENVPLYPEMRVAEYLNHRARLKDVPRRRRRGGITEALVKCGLSEVEERILGQLSRGYRQRVGLADALLNDPPILILDEPTAGLDPIQIREVRDLIRELGRLHTILLSTHIMSEVEAVCGRVIIIAGGTIALDERLEQLQAAPVIVIEARGPAKAIADVVRSIAGVERVVPTSVTEDFAAFDVQTREGVDLREILGRCITSSGWGLRRLDLRRRSLEDHFVQAVMQANSSKTGLQTKQA